MPPVWGLKKWAYQRFAGTDKDIFLTLGASLDIKIVSKIHAGQYVDLTLLSSEADSAQQLEFDPITKVLTMAGVSCCQQKSFYLPRYMALDLKHISVILMC